MMEAVDIYKLLKSVDTAHGTDNPTGRIIGTAIILRESGGDPKAYRPASKNPGGGNDRGLWQINSKYHPTVSDDMAFNPLQATEYAYKLSKGFKEWGPWEGAKLDSKFITKGYEASKAAGDNVPVNGFGAGDVVGFVGDTVGDAVSTVTGGIGSVIDFLSLLTKAETWVRVAKVIVGILLVLLGVSAWTKGAGTLVKSVLP